MQFFLCDAFIVSGSDSRGFSNSIPAWRAALDLDHLSKSLRWAGVVA
jgi:hypothetical protein